MSGITEENQDPVSAEEQLDILIKCLPDAPFKDRVREAVADLRAQLAAANKRHEEAEKQEPVTNITEAKKYGAVAWVKYNGGVLVNYSLYNGVDLPDNETGYFLAPVRRPIPPADVEAQRDLAESEEVRELMAKILHDTAIALKGPSAELSRHSWHDLAEVAAKNALDAGARIAELERKLAEQQAAMKLAEEALEQTAAEYRSGYLKGGSVRVSDLRVEAWKAVSNCERAELADILSEAGTKEAAPEGWQVGDDIRIFANAATGFAVGTQSVTALHIPTGKSCTSSRHRSLWIMRKEAVEGLRAMLAATSTANADPAETKCKWGEVKHDAKEGGE